MVNYSTAVDRTFSALGDPTRRAIVQRLAMGEATVTELAQPFPVSLPAISKHLGILEAAGLLVRKRTGRIHRCQLNVEPLREASQWIEYYAAFWKTQLDSFGQYLQQASSNSHAMEDNVWKNALPHQSVPSNSGASIPQVRKRSSGLGQTQKR